MARPPFPEDLVAELHIVEMVAKARRAAQVAADADAALWSDAEYLNRNRALSIDTLARLTDQSTATVARRFASLRHRSQVPR